MPDTSDEAGADLDLCHKSDGTERPLPSVRPAFIFSATAHHNLLADANLGYAAS